MDSVAMAEELAWLIKGNYPCKHFVLSAEEAFVTFLDPQQKSRTGNILTLEPMDAYRRMLLHRLADIFRLGHESMGQGQDRHIVLERCKDSCIPNVLVSDILEYNEDDQLSTCSQTAPQLLKRKTSLSDAQKNTQIQSSQVSFEERQAAYLAARERIFSEDMGQSAAQSSASRPRSVPVVAQRMIAHALGKRILAEQNVKTPSNSEPARVREFDSTCVRSNGEEPIECALVGGGTCSSTADSDVDDANPQATRTAEYLQATAAKRMFAHALGLGSSKTVCKGYNRSAEKKVLRSECLQSFSHLNVKEASSSAELDVLEKDGQMSKTIPFSICDHGRTAQFEQGKAAQRMFAQALGFRSLSLVTERPKSS